ncbi:hypothetical protein MANES_08G054602v8 [Manihot esculenta]|uniref:Uncharacterized protein n=1 Tax=Manihot esculenta TaxID=3983 RepID=A0ACB7H9N5_MANES|nr:hypothetical protein MANES_08G054602v8 [Manihot esculenta]
MLPQCNWGKDYEEVTVIVVFYVIFSEMTCLTSYHYLNAEVTDDNLTSIYTWNY